MKKVLKIRSRCHNDLKVRSQKIVYTAILGAYDTLKTPKVISKNWNYVCFTDDINLKSDVWDIRLIDKNVFSAKGALMADNSRRLGKYFKMKPYELFPECSESLWIDASFEILKDVDEFVSENSTNTDLLCFIHPERDCIYDEAKVIVDMGLAPKSETEAQVERYRANGYPEHNGLIAGGILYRKHTEAVRKLMDMWYAETMNGTPRDQLSFNFSAWKLGFEYDLSIKNYFDNDYFKFLPHNASSEKLIARLYLETENRPFSEETVIVETVGCPDGRFEINFELGELNMGLTALRFDPGEEPICIRIDSAILTDLNGNTEPLVFVWSNGIERNGVFEFDKFDPMLCYELLNTKIVAYQVKFSGKVFLTPTATTRAESSNSTYTIEFFRQRKALSKRSAELVVPKIMQLLPKEFRANLSVIDFGCATGDWLKVWQDNGADEIMGVNDTMPDSMLIEIPEEYLLIEDLSKKNALTLTKRFTICQCLEVAEHLYENDLGNLLDTLTAASDIILFSAAIPYQEGTHHVNCQWPEYWIARFSEYGYLVADCMRPAIWNQKEINVIYRQNMFMFFRDTERNSFLKLLSERNRLEQYNLVHPDIWEIYRTR